MKNLLCLLTVGVGLGILPIFTFHLHIEKNKDTGYGKNVSEETRGGNFIHNNENGTLSDVVNTSFVERSRKAKGASLNDTGSIDSSKDKPESRDSEGAPSNGKRSKRKVGFLRKRDSGVKRKPVWKKLRIGSKKTGVNPKKGIKKTRKSGLNKAKTDSKKRKGNTSSKSLTKNEKKEARKTNSNASNRKRNNGGKTKKDNKRSKGRKTREEPVVLDEKETQAVNTVGQYPQVEGNDATDLGTKVSKGTSSNFKPITKVKRPSEIAEDEPILANNDNDIQENEAIENNTDEVYSETSIPTNEPDGKSEEHSEARSEEELNEEGLQELFGDDGGDEVPATSEPDEEALLDDQETAENEAESARGQEDGIDGNNRDEASVAEANGEEEEPSKKYNRVKTPADPRSHNKKNSRSSVLQHEEEREEASVVDSPQEIPQPTSPHYQTLEAEEGSKSEEEDSVTNTEDESNDFTIEDSVINDSLDPEESIQSLELYSKPDGDDTADEESISTQDTTENRLDMNDLDRIMDDEDEEYIDDEAEVRVDTPKSDEVDDKGSGLMDDLLFDRYHDKNIITDNIEGDDEGEDVDNYDSPLGLEYLGAGYDMIRGNPLGDTVTLLDPGFRANIVQMHWKKDQDGLSSSMKYIQPSGGWIRSYLSCHKGDSMEEVSNEDSIKRALSVDASVSTELPGDALKFSASVGYNNLAKSKEKKGLKSYVSKSYCFNYVAGIPTSIKWDLTLAFDNALKTLPSTFTYETKDSRCSPTDYRVDPFKQACIDLGIQKWMKFFNTFGTHVTTKIYLGGKLVTLMETNAKQEEKLASLGIDVKAALAAKTVDNNVEATVEASSSKLRDNSETTFDSKNSTFVLGGDIYGSGSGESFNKWAASVASFSMPIKAEYTPISFFMKPEYRDAYNEAYLFYGKVLVGNPL